MSRRFRRYIRFCWCVAGVSHAGALSHADPADWSEDIRSVGLTPAGRDVGMPRPHPNGDNILNTNVSRRSRRLDGFCWWVLALVKKYQNQMICFINVE